MLKDNINHKKEEYLQDSIHGNQQYPPILKKIIYSVPVVRLQYISQLGLIENVYPGGSGTRFEHSIGVMFLMKEFFNKIIKNNGKYDMWCEVAMLTGLLHDIGHGPYSHLFEKTTGIIHEDMTIKIIEKCLLKDEENPQLKKIIKISLDIISSVYKVDADFLKEYRGDSIKCFMIIRCLLSGAFDLDKLDYVMRDLSKLGFGSRSVDYDWIFNKIDFYYDDEKPENSFIFFAEDACTAIDEFIFKRIAYYWKCLYHRDVRLHELLLGHIISNCKLIFKNINRQMKVPDNINNFKKILIYKKIALNKYLNIDDNTCREFIKYLHSELASRKKDDIFSKIVEDVLTRPKSYRLLYENHDDKIQISPEDIFSILKKIKDKYFNGNLPDSYDEFLIFWDQPRLENHIIKENQDIKIRRNFFKNKNDKFFNLLNRSKIRELFVNSTTCIRYYVYDPDGTITKEFREEYFDSRG